MSKRNPRKPKKGYVYILTAFWGNKFIYKFGATTKNPRDRIKYARSRIISDGSINAGSKNNLLYKVLISHRCNDIFALENKIKHAIWSVNRHPHDANIDFPFDCNEMISSDASLTKFFNEIIGISNEQEARLV